MRKLLILLVFISFPTLVLATDKIWHSGELIESISKNPSIDGRPIILEGEVISEPIERKDGCWVNVTDGSIAIGVFFKDCSQTKSVKYWGQHMIKGDTVRIAGKIYKADKETNGELDVQGETLTVVSQGYPTEETIPTWKIILAALLGLIALMFVCDKLSQYTRNRRTKNQNLLSSFFENGSSNYY